MKIINAHLHLIELDKVAGQEKYLSVLKSISAFANLEQTVGLLSMDSILGQMDEAGIAKSVIFALYAPILFASNEFVAQICAKYPERFMGFASVDPKQKDSPQVLEEAVKNLGLCGLKLHPPLQDVYPNDESLWPLYEKAASLNIPVVFHVGSTPFGSLVKLAQADPILIDEVAISFPKLKIVLTHLGTLWHNETFMVAEKNPNVFIDTTAYPYELKALLTKDLIERVGSHKFIFGTDFPMPYEGHTHKMKDYVDCINGLDLSQEIKENIFYKNFERLLAHE